MDVRKQLNKIKSESKELMSKHVKYNKAIQDLINAEDRDVAERFSTKYAYTKYVNLRVQKAIKKLWKEIKLIHTPSTIRIDASYSYDVVIKAIIKSDDESEAISRF